MEKELISDKQCSIEISRTTKGIYSWKAKIYYNDDKRTKTQIIEELERIDKELQIKFNGGKDE